MRQRRVSWIRRVSGYFLGQPESRVSERRSEFRYTVALPRGAQRLVNTHRSAAVAAAGKRERGKGKSIKDEDKKQERRGGGGGNEPGIARLGGNQLAGERSAGERPSGDLPSRAKPLINAFAKKLHAVGGKQEQEGVGCARSDARRDQRARSLFLPFSLVPYTWHLRLASVASVPFSQRGEPLPVRTVCTCTFSSRPSSSPCRGACESTFAGANSIEILVQIARALSYESLRLRQIARDPCPLLRPSPFPLPRSTLPDRALPPRSTRFSRYSRTFVWLEGQRASESA